MFPRNHIRFELKQRFHRSCVGWLRGVVALCSVVLVAAAQEFEVKSGFSTAETTVGREVAYSISIQKVNGATELTLNSPERPNLPKTSALTFGRFQTSEQYQSALGSDPVGITLEFEAVTNVEGRIIMPSFTMDYMGRQLQIPAASLQVRSPESDLTGGEIEWFFFELSDKPKTLHVGQQYKTSLNLMVFKGLRSVTYASPTPVGSDFAMGQISPGPTERVITQGLYRYSVYSWPLTFSAVRSGKISVSFKVNLNFRIPNDRVEFIRAVRANNGEGMATIEALLQDSREESQIVFSENLNLQVEPLPVPKNESSYFNAIGEFSIATKVENTNISVGEPTKLSIVLSGEGNFSSLRTPTLQLDNRWRVFAPQEEFLDQDFLGYKGEQTYQYVIIPLSTDLKSIPEIEYTYFDVRENAYQTLKSEAVEIRISGETIASELDVTGPEVEEDASDEAEISLNSSIRWKMGRRQTMAQPFFKRFGFYAFQFVIFTGFGVLVFMRLRKLRLERDAIFARQLQIHTWIRKYLRLAGAAAKEEDSEQFYESAFLAFCAVVASSNEANVEAITVEDVQIRLKKMNLNDNVKRVVEGYLSRYEQHRFSGKLLDNPPLKHEFNRLKSILKKFDSQLELATES